MTDNDITALIAEAREYADFGNGLNWQGKIRELADALESRPMTADRTAILDAYGPIVDAVVAVLRPIADVQAEVVSETPKKVEAIAKRAEQILDAESHNQVCSCLGHPEACVTYGDLTKFKLSHSDAGLWTRAVLTALREYMTPASPNSEEPTSG